MYKSSVAMALNATKANPHHIKMIKSNATKNPENKKENLGAFWAMRGIVKGAFHPTKSIKEMKSEWLSEDYKESNL